MKNLTPIMFLAIVITACATNYKVVSFSNDSIDLSKYNTYQIINYKKGKEDFSKQGELYFSKIENGIKSGLESKKYMVSDQPDMIVRYEIISNLNVRQNSGNSNYYQNGYYDQFYNQNNNTSRQIEGILLIEMKDRKTKKLIWQGSLDLKYSRKSDKNKDLLTNAVETILLEYNYNAGSNNQITLENK